MDTLISNEAQLNELIQKGEFTAAINFIDNYLNKKSLSNYVKKTLLFNKAKCLYLKKEYRKAMLLSQQAIKIPLPNYGNLIEAKLKVITGKVLYNQGFYNKALQGFLESYELLRLSSENFEIGNVQKYLAWCYVDIGDIKKAKTYLEDAISSFRRLGEFVEVARIRYELATVCIITSEWKNGIEYLEDAIELSLSNKKHKDLPIFYNTMGIFNMCLGDFKKAMNYFKKSIRMANRFGHDYEQIHANLLIGRLYVQKRRFGEASRHLQQGIRRASEKGMRRDVAIGYEYLGELAFEMGEYGKAEEYYEKDREIAEEIAPEGDLINELFRRIGDLKVRTGDLEGAWVATERALEVSRRLGDRYEEALVYRVRGLIYEERGEREEALSNLRHCLKTLSSLDEKYERARTHLEIARLLGETWEGEEDLNSAEQNLREAMEIFEELEIGYYRARVVMEMARIAAIRGNDKGVIERLRYARGIYLGTSDEEELTSMARGIKRSLEESIVDRVLSGQGQRHLLERAGASALLAYFPYGIGGLEKILSHLVEIVGARRGFIASRNGPGGGYTVSVAKGMEASLGHEIIDYLQGVDKRIFNEKRPFLSIDVTRDDRFDAAERDRLFGAGSVAVVPFGVGGEVGGVCYIDRGADGSRGPLLYDDLKEVADVSGHIASFVSAMERTEYHEDERGSGIGFNPRAGVGKIITQDPKMFEVLEIVHQIKDSTIPALLIGETGTGKELIARAIHSTGVRKDRRYIAVNCAALPSNLLESELFGHRKGSFTGAISDKKGLFEVADKGTFFLDEIADMGLGTQVKLLRVLENGEFKRLGDTTIRKVDVRIISATNRDLAEEVEAGRFREDLYYRLEGIKIEIPPLRERRADIPLLISRFIERYAFEEGKKIRGVAPDALNLLISYNWPGNVRELINEIRRAVSMVRGEEEIGVRHLSGKIKKSVLGRMKPGEETQVGSTLPELMASFEKQRIFMALRDARWIKTRAARQLGIHEATLRGKMKRYGLEAPINL